MLKDKVDTLFILFPLILFLLLVLYMLSSDLDKFGPL